MRALLLVVGAVAPLYGQAVDSRLEGRIPDAAVPVVDSLVRRAAAESLPTEPLLQKALEGGAKRVPSERIVSAVTIRLAQLRDARALLVRAGDVPPTTAVEVETVAEAVRRGLPTATVERLVGALPAAPRASALHAVADMASHHVDADSAAGLIIDAIHQGLRGPRLLDVSHAAVEQLQRGDTPAQALAHVRSLLPNVPPAPNPARATVQRAKRPNNLSAAHP